MHSAFDRMQYEHGFLRSHFTLRWRQKVQLRGWVEGSGIDCVANAVSSVAPGGFSVTLAGTAHDNDDELFPGFAGGARGDKLCCSMVRNWLWGSSQIGVEYK